MSHFKLVPEDPEANKHGLARTYGPTAHNTQHTSGHQMSQFIYIRHISYQLVTFINHLDVQVEQSIGCLYVCKQ